MVKTSVMCLLSAFLFWAYNMYNYVSDCESLLAVLKGVVLIVSGVMILAAM